MRLHGFEEVNHTADLAICVWGEDFKALLVQAAQGLYHLLDIKTNEDSKLSTSFLIEFGSCEVMLVDFLNELLYLCEDHKQRFCSFSLTEEDDRLLVRAEGEAVVSIKRNIKAVTFHDLDIRKNGDGIITTITFDV